METDFYFDCPICTHTVMVDAGLVGQLVECPDCLNEIKVPEIRDGLNPRFKAEEAYRRALRDVPPVPKREGVVAEVLVENLECLLRRREEQGRQMDYICHNAELCLKQIQLLQKPSAEVGAPSSAASAESDDSSVKGNGFLKCSVGFACLTVVAAVVVLFLL
jgi:hypothetical protein